MNLCLTHHSDSIWTCLFTLWVCAVPVYIICVITLYNVCQHVPHSWQTTVCGFRQVMKGSEAERGQSLIWLDVRPYKCNNCNGRICVERCCNCGDQHEVHILWVRSPSFSLSNCRQRTRPLQSLSDTGTQWLLWFTVHGTSAAISAAFHLHVDFYETVQHKLIF